MNVSQQPFMPMPNGTVSISVGAASQSVQIQTVEDANSCVRVYNAGTATVWVEFDSTTATASMSTSMPIPAGGVYIFGDPQQYAAAIAVGATGLIYFTPGNGVS